MLLIYDITNLLVDNFINQNKRHLSAFYGYYLTE